jgi:hypothetical protein
LPNKEDELVVEADAELVVATVGIRRTVPPAEDIAATNPPDEADTAALVMLGRAETAKAAGTTQKTANKLIVFLRNAIPLLHFYYFILS